MIAVIIAVSASAFDSDKEHSLRVGCDGFLPKPVKIDQLFTLIQQTLKLKWVYGEEMNEGEKMTDETVFLATLSQIIPPPRAEMEILLNLAKCGKIRHIQERATYLTELDEKFIPFARKLQQLASRFQERALLTLVQQYMELENRF